MITQEFALKVLDDSLSDEKYQGFYPQMRNLRALDSRANVEGNLEDLTLCQADSREGDSISIYHYVAKAKDWKTYDNLYDYLADNGVFERCVDKVEPRGDHGVALTDECIIGRVEIDDEEKKESDYEYKRLTILLGDVNDSAHPIVHLTVYNPNYSGPIKIPKTEVITYEANTPEYALWAEHRGPKGPIHPQKL